VQRLTLSRLIAAAILSALAAMVPPRDAQAQTTTTTPKVFFACYVPSSGTTYRIKEVDLKQECSKSTHVQFSWTDGTSAITQFFTVVEDIHTLGPGTQELVTQACPAGSQVVGGGHRFILKGLPDFPFVTRSTPSDDGNGWSVLVANPVTSTSTVTFTVYARCAK
jgi:hypothetical protein